MELVYKEPPEESSSCQHHELGTFGKKFLNGVEIGLECPHCGLFVYDTKREKEE